MTDIKSHANLVWGIAELLRGDYKQADYGKVILPLVVIRRLDQTLENTKAQVVERSEQLKAQGIENVELVLVRVSKQQFYNDSPLTLTQLLGDAPRLAINAEHAERGYDGRFGPGLPRKSDGQLLFLLVKIVDGTSLGYRTIAVEQLLRGRYVLDSAKWTGLPDDK